MNTLFGSNPAQSTLVQFTRLQILMRIQWELISHSTNLLFRAKIIYAINNSLQKTCKHRKTSFNRNENYKKIYCGNDWLFKETNKIYEVSRILNYSLSLSLSCVLCLMHSITPLVARVARPNKLLQPLSTAPRYERAPSLRLFPLVLVLGILGSTRSICYFLSPVRL